MRGKLSLLIILIIGAGLLSRSEVALLVIPLGVGDAFYGTLVYLLVCWINTSLVPKRVFWISLLCCFAIEFSQLITVDWFESFRHTILGKLVFGNNFKPSDLVYLALGVAAGMIIDIKFIRRSATKPVTK